jgi:hypothetical protein
MDLVVFEHSGVVAEDLLLQQVLPQRLQLNQFKQNSKSTLQISPTI